MASTWKGAMELAGFPVNVALYNRTKSRGSDSFRTLAPNGKPVKTQYVDTEGNLVARDLTSKGIETSKDVFVPLTPEAVETIGSRQRSTLVQPDSFAPLDSVPLDLSLATYKVTHDAKVPGSERSVNVLWNGLRTSGLVYVTTFTPSTRDAILVVWADAQGLWAATLPFTTELAEVPAGDFHEDDAAATMFAQVVEAQYEVKPFDHAAYVSEYKQRRDAAVQAVLEGREVERPAEVTASPDTPDLMSALSEAVAKVGKKKAPAKKSTAKKEVAA